VSAQIREILISESAWEEMTCLFAPSLEDGIDPAELLLAVGSTKPKTKSTRTPRPAKYKYTDDNGNEQTWTGQGRTPKAIATAIEAGKTLEDFAI
ncbi:H-NS family nucleoid-associated regulatory protein, partial [Klebsiella pneumoniae]|uniref:H-NS family nucleoid-associated regulatory protein n=1 Tax=Klebsiella pneumoniae TaxID=573 RepID=UPI002181E918